MDDQLSFELGIIDVSSVSVTMGVLTVVAVLPAAAMISFLFRLREVKLTGSRVKETRGRKTEKDFFEDALSVTDSTFEPHLFWSSLQQWAQEARKKRYQGTDLLPASTMIMENKNTDKVVIRKEAFENNMGAALQNLLLVTEDNDIDHASQGKESDLSSESSRFHESHKAFWVRDGGQAVQKEEDLQAKEKEGCHHQAAWPGHSHMINRLKVRGFRSICQWCHYLSWTLCLLLSLSCLVLSAGLGMRFSSSKVLLWIHSLFFSLVSCIFIIQPAVIITVAMTVSFWYRKRADFHSFSCIREFDIETSQLWSHSVADRPEETSASSQERCSHLEKLLGARQRARYLRLVCPPTQAELRKTRWKKRRETLLRNTLRDLSICGSMLILMLCVNYDSSLTDRYHLNKAVRKQFVSSGHDNTFMSIQNHEDWWKWAQTSLLNLLYKNVSATSQSHVLIGEPVLWKTEVSSSFQDEVSSVTLLPECLRLFLSKIRTSTHPQSNVLVPMASPLRTFATVGFGNTRSDAVAKLKLLHSRGWLAKQMVAVKIQFTLFSPAPNLFTGVTMLTERSTASVLLSSAKVQSVRVYHTPAVWDYVVMVCQLLFLLLSLLELCDQVYTVGQQGLMGYWRTQRSWLEVSLLAVTLVYYVYYICHSIIILEVVELLQRHSRRGHIDVGLLATWEQCIRSLRGVMLFLLTMKCMTVLRVTRMLASSAVLLSRSLSSLFWPMISGFILMVALSCMGHMHGTQSSWVFSSPSPLLCHGFGPKAMRGHPLSWFDFLYHGVFYLSSSVTIGVVSSLVRRTRRSQNRGNVFTAAEFVGYIRRTVSDFTGQQKQASIENHVEAKTYYLEEFESLVDELLIRLNTLSNSLYHTLPAKAHRYREDSPVFSPIQEPSNMDTQDFVQRQMTEELMVSDHTDVSGCGETLPASHLLRCEEIPEDGALQTSLKTQNYLPLPEATSLMKIWVDDDLQKQADHSTKTNDSHWLSNSKATHTEVVVEVLVHEDPGSVEPDK